MSEGIESSEQEASERSTASVMPEAEAREGCKWVQLGPKSIEIPEEWELRRFDALTTNSGRYGANASAQEFNVEQPRYIRITDISDHGSLKDGDARSLPLQDCEDYLLEPRQLLFARTGATVGKTYLYRETDATAAYAGYLIMFQPDTREAGPEFLFHFTQSKLYDDWVAMMTRHGAQQNINASEYSSMRLPVPSLSEQHRIAEVLSTVDEQIQQTEAVIETTKELKQGLMQDLLISGTRNSRNFQQISLGPKTLEIPSSWNIATIDELTDTVTDGTHSSPETLKSGKPYLTSKNIRTWGFELDELKYVSEEDFQQINSRCEPRKGDILYVKDGANTGVAQVNSLDFEFCLLSSVALIRPSEELSGGFLQQQLSWQLFRQVMASRMSGTGIKRLTIEKIKKSHILVPPIDEQQHIADILNRVDNKIAEEREQKQLLQELKHGLMQDLLTGTVRVPESIEVED